VTAPHPRLLAPAAIDWDGDVPVSRTTGDVYFSRSGGVAETEAVFVAGNDLDERFAAGTCRCIGETGFGTGLNFLVARRRFLERAPAHARLHFVSVEHAPLAPADRRRFADALDAVGHGALAEDARRLATLLPLPVAGWHRLVLDGGRVRLSLWLGDAAAGLDDWLATDPEPIVDAWFLDGFAPRLNPELWEASVATRLARLSAPGATLGTFSVARSVRDALTGAGFAVERVPAGTGKREVLRGRRPGTAAPPAPPRHAVVVGAGLAGAFVAAALAERGTAVTVLDAEGPARGASGNPWAVLHPRLPLDDGPRAAFLLAAWRFALARLGALGAESGWRPRPLRQVPEVRRPERLERVLARFAALAPDLRADRVGALPALALDAAGDADLPRLVATLLAHEAIEVRAPASVTAVREGPAVVLDDGSVVDADAVVIAAGPGTAALAAPGPALGRMRGQLTRVAGPTPAADAPILTGRGHAVPTADGWVVGSSYVRDGDAGAPTAAEQAENLERLAAWEAVTGTAMVGTVVEEFAGVRCTTPDRVPCIGRGAPGVWSSTGHASSGLLTAPIAAEAIAADLHGEPPVLDGELRALLDPMR
jgi:tRNA 5-methylaminomethyl-2-thiouridine biosynthesis bifunctional protein